MFNTKPNEEIKKPAFSLHLSLSEESTRWLVGILAAITCGSSIVWISQSPPSSVPIPSQQQQTQQ